MSTFCLSSVLSLPTRPVLCACVVCGVKYSAPLDPQLSELSASKPRYFINSLTHRLKQRLLQTLLLLLPHLPPVRPHSLNNSPVIIFLPVGWSESFGSGDPEGSAE